MADISQTFQNFSWEKDAEKIIKQICQTFKQGDFVTGEGVKSILQGMNVKSEKVYELVAKLDKMEKINDAENAFKLYVVNGQDVEQTFKIAGSDKSFKLSHESTVKFEFLPEKTKIITSGVKVKLFAFIPLPNLSLKGNDISL